MATDTSMAPEKKLTGAALSTPDGQQPQGGDSGGDTGTGNDPEFEEARTDTDATLAGLRDQIAAQDEKIAGLTDERDAAVARAEKAEKSAKTAKAAVKKGEMPDKPRALKAYGEDEGPDRDELREKIAGAESVEIAFSDGKREIAGIAPAIVASTAFREHSRGLLLDGEVEIEGPATGTSVAIDGYALLIDGKQVAYSKRSDRLNVAPGQKVSLVGDIIF